MPYTIPQQFTALHAHTTYSMLHGGLPYRGYSPEFLQAPFIPFGIPVPPVPIKRTHKQHSPQKSQPSGSEKSVKSGGIREEEPRLTQPTPTSMQVAAAPKLSHVGGLDLHSPPVNFPMPHPQPIKPQPMLVFDIQDEREGGGGKAKRRKKKQRHMPSTVILKGSEFAETSA
jgi:hypothetical protein